MMAPKPLISVNISPDPSAAFKAGAGMQSDQFIRRIDGWTEIGN
jgi:hypothetical protein